MDASMAIMTATEKWMDQAASRNALGIAQVTPAHVTKIMDGVMLDAQRDMVAMAMTLSLPAM